MSVCLIDACVPGSPVLEPYFNLSRLQIQMLGELILLLLLIKEQNSNQNWRFCEGLRGAIRSSDHMIHHIENLAEIYLNPEEPN
jgi:hypothetical protein